MATIEECRSALDKLSDNMASAEGDVHSAAALDRSLSCRITDLDITFVGRLKDGRIEVLDTVHGPPPEKAEIRLAMTGDDQWVEPNLWAGVGQVRRGVGVTLVGSYEQVAR